MQPYQARKWWQKGHLSINDCIQHPWQHEDLSDSGPAVKNYQKGTCYPTQTAAQINTPSQQTGCSNWLHIYGGKFRVKYKSTPGPSVGIRWYDLDHLGYLHSFLSEPPKAQGYIFSCMWPCVRIVYDTSAYCESLREKWNKEQKMNTPNYKGPLPE